MKTLKAILCTIVMSLVLPLAAEAKIPWGAISSVTSSTTPTCASFSTDPVCIIASGANIATLTVSGGTAPNNYTLIIVQDGTGSRTLAWPTNITAASSFNGGVLPTITTAANSYSAIVLQAVGATPVYQVVGEYDNPNLSSEYVQTITSAGTAVALNAMAAAAASPVIASSIAPGVVSTSQCTCTADTLPATWQTGVFLTCLPTTNYATCEIVNPTAATITPAAVVVTVHIIQ